MLDFILRCANDVPQESESTADWKDLLEESKKLQAELDASASPDTAIEYARLLEQGTPVDERQRKLKGLRLASDLRNQAPSYELVKANVPRPEPHDTKYIRHGAQTIGLKKLNGWERPVRRVNLSGVEIELNKLDRSDFLKTYSYGFLKPDSGQQDIQELYIYADTVVIQTKVHFPQTNVFIYCRELYFEGADACIDTQPVVTAYRASLDKDGSDGAQGNRAMLFPLITADDTDH